MRGLARADGKPERERVADWAYDRIRAAILQGGQGGLAPGAHLSVPALAEQLAVSRSPVREAVIRLVREGLAEDEPHRGAAVARVGAAELRRVYEVREVLEGLAARLATQRADRVLLSALSATLEEHRTVVALGDLQAHIEADMHFHRLTRTATGNDPLVVLLDEIQGKIQLAMPTTSVLAGSEQAVRDHEAILAAIQSGDPEEAERVARAHVRRLRHALADHPRDDTRASR